MNATVIPAAEVNKRRLQGERVELVDVRTPVEFREVHADSARNIPLDTLDATQAEKLVSAGSVYLICRTGERATKAAKRFADVEAQDVYIVEGGTDAWIAQGLNVVRGKKAVSLERQVRIAAGALVFLGSLLTFFVSPYFVALPAFVGAGLVFAGVTDTCGMALLLAKMPWNRVKKECGACQV